MELEKNGQDNQHSDKKKSNQICGWCRQRFPSGAKPMILPTHLLCTHDDNNKHGKLYCRGIDLTCSSACCFSLYDDTVRLDPDNPLYKDTLSLIKDLIYFEHGKKYLNEQRRAPHWRMLQANGGKMSPEEFYGCNNIYRESSNVLFSMVSFQYETILE
jgi:hypothetical protein